MTQVGEWLITHGVTHVHALPDLRGYGDVGMVTVVWQEGPTAREVAEAHAVDTRDGLPLLPCWLGLKAFHDFDMRWQPPY